jgi:hypothetical protein
VIEAEDRESAEHWYLKWTFIAAIVAAFAAAVGVVLMIAGIRFFPPACLAGVLVLLLLP